MTPLQSLPQTTGPGTPPPGPAPGEPPMSKPKILIIEDDRALVEPLAYNLRREGYDVSAAHDGQDGLQRQVAIRSSPGSPRACRRA